MEITEEEEEEQRETKRQSVIEDKIVPGEIDATPARPQSPISGPPVTLDASIATSPKQSKFANTAEVPSFAGSAREPRPASPSKSFDADTDPGRRMSSQSSRQDYYTSSSYLSTKARVKLGPRPSADAAGRPRSSGDTKRPVASMPAGLKLLLKGGKKSKTQDDASSVISQEASEDTFQASTLGIDVNRPHTSGGRPPSSSGISVKSMPDSSAPTKSAMTPEKLRLMKALQLREKKRRESAAPAPAIPSLESKPPPVSEEQHLQTASEIPPVEIIAASEPALDQEATETIADSADAPHVVQRQTKEENELAADQQSVSKADSAIDVVTSAPTDQTSEHTRTDSRPPSPVYASDGVDSTKASSISESTDETIHPAEVKTDNEGKEEVQVETKVDEAQTGDVSTTPDAEIEAGDAPGTAEQEAPKASLSQTEQKSEVNTAEAVEEDHAISAPNEHLAESAFIPTSKFASKLPSGQAAMDPLEIRGQDPLNVTNVASEPGRIDEADPAPVDTLERTEDGTSAPSSKWNLPISKYSSTHDTSISLTSSPIPDIVTSSADDASPNGQNAIADPAVKMVDDGTTDENRRSGLPEPIVTSAISPIKETSQENGDVTDEQQSATNDNDDARSPMAMSPISENPPALPMTPRQGVLRTVSTPAQSSLAHAGDAPPLATPSRSISSGSAFNQRMNQQPPSSAHLAPGRQPGKLGGSLASRIKAFEQLAATKETTVAAAPVISSVKDRPSSAFFSVQRNNSTRDGARSPGPSVMSRTNSIYRGRTPTPAGSEDSPESVMGGVRRERSGSVASRLSVFEGGSAPRGKPETVQVTARIVREPGQIYPKAPGSNVDPTEYSSLDLKQSPLIVDHRKDVETPNPTTAAEAAPIPTPLVHAAGEPRRSLQERRLSRDKRGSIDASKDGLSRPGQRTSLTMARDFFRDSMAGKDGSSLGRPPSMHLQSNSLLNRLSVHTRGKSIGQESTHLSPSSVTEKSESGDEKKEGTRASRLMRRLSSTFSPGRKQSTSSAVASPVLTEEYADDPEKTPRAATAPPTATFSKVVAIMGDVNVQFPENLLWKRRTMSLDSNGFLHLSPNQGAMSSRERQLKRFHMSEFQLPYTPEMEFQELPNSVCLDFKTGSGLQIALQDRISQQNVLLGEFISNRIQW